MAAVHGTRKTDAAKKVTNSGTGANERALFKLLKVLAVSEGDGSQGGAEQQRGIL